MGTADMSVSPAATRKATEPASLIKIGAKSGAATGFGLGLAYGFLFLAVFVVIGLVASAGSANAVDETILDEVASWLLVVVVGSIVVFLVAAIPATLLGLLTGLTVSFLLTRFAREQWDRVAVPLGLTVSLCIVASLHATLFFALDANLPTRDDWLSYAGLLGIPSLIYIVAGGWMSRRLSR